MGTVQALKAVWLAAGFITLGATVIAFHDILLVFFAGAVFAVPLRRATVTLSARLRLPHVTTTFDFTQ